MNKLRSFLLAARQNSWQSPAQRRVLANIFSLSVLQGLNIVLPLLTLPYLVRSLGDERFGLLAFATALITYFSILTNYGFHITATREVSVHRQDAVKLTEIFSTVLWIKMLFFGICLGVLLMGMLFFEQLQAEATVYLWTFGVLCGQVLFPVWFFQGMEQMKYITYLSLATKTLYTLAIFGLIQQPADYVLVPMLISLEGIVLGIWSLVLIKRKYGISIGWPTKAGFRYYLVDGWHVFLANLSVSLYTNTTVVLLGMFTNHVLVGHYSMADKLIAGFKQLMNPLSQALYPYLSRQSVSSKQAVLATLRRLLKYVGALGLLSTAGLWFFAAPLLKALFGEAGMPAVPIFRILLFVPFLGMLDNVFGTLLMLVFKKQAAYSRIIVGAGILNVVLAVWLIQYQSVWGGALAVLLTELFITITMILYTHFNGLSLLKNAEDA